MNPSARLAALAAALKYSHPGAALALLDLVVAVQRLEATVDDLTAEAMEQEDLDQDAARRIGFSSRHAEAMQTLRQAAERVGPITIRPDYFDRPEYLQRRKGDPA
jgi:hypothetical protein